MKFITTQFNPGGTLRELAQSLGRMLTHLQERLDVDSVRVGDTTKLDHDGGVTVGAFTMAEGAAANKLLTSDASGAGTWEDAPTTVAGSDTEVQYNDGGTLAGDDAMTWNKATNVLSIDQSTFGTDVSIGGDLTVGYINLDGTETSELIDVDRTIDGNCTEHAVSVFDDLSGLVTTDGYAGFYGKTKVDATFANDHSSFLGELDYDAGTSQQLTSFRGLATLAAAKTAKAALFGGVMMADGTTGKTPPETLAPVSVLMSGDSASARYAAYTRSLNVGTGAATGYYGYGENSSAGTTLNAIGLYGYSNSHNGLSTGVYGAVMSGNTKRFAYYGKGHNHYHDGNTYLYEFTALATVTDKTHVLAAGAGSLWIEDDLEVDGIAYFDGGAEVGTAAAPADLTLSRELKGGRCMIDAAENQSSISASRYMDANNGLQMTASRGYPMARAGSIVGVAGVTKVVSSSGGTCHIDVYKNGTLAASTGALTCNDHIGSYKSWSNTAARGTVTFVADDILQFYIRITGTCVVQYPIATAELQFDT